MLVHRRVTWFIYYEVTRSITTPYWMGCYYYSPLNGMLVCHRVFWFLLLPPSWDDSLSQSYLVQLYTLKCLTVFVLPLVGMLVHHRVTWFIYYEVTGSISTPPGWDVSPSQGDQQHYAYWYLFVHLGEERQCEANVSA